MTNPTGSKIHYNDLVRFERMKFNADLSCGLPETIDSIELFNEKFNPLLKIGSCSIWLDISIVKQYFKELYK